VTLVVCPNLAVDRVLEAAQLAPGSLHRLRCLQHQAGGKGANVARVLRAFGAHALLVGLAAGSTGRLIGDLATAEGLDVLLVAADGEARISNVVLESDGRVTEFYEHGPEVSPEIAEALLQTAREQGIRDRGWAIVNGHAPPGSGPEFYGRLVHVLRAAGRPVMIDAAGPQLAHALSEGPDFVKVNALEACSAVGDPAGPGASAALSLDESGRSDAPTASMPADHGDCDAESAALSDEERVERGQELCRRLVEAGAARAAVTIGAAGAVALDGRRFYHARTQPVDVVSTVGSGDSFAARLLLGLERDEELGAALAGAAAAASVNAASPFTAHLTAQEVARLAKGATVRVTGG
jgi:fructose-1-phosphate kinase PfkB-like protein